MSSLVISTVISLLPCIHLKKVGEVGVGCVAVCFSVLLSNKLALTQPKQNIM